MIGQGANLVVDGFTLATMGPRPTLGNKNGAGVVLANGVELSGFNVEDTLTDGIVGTSISTPVSITSVSITQAGHSGHKLQGVSSDSSISTIDISNIGLSGVDVSDSTGQLTFLEVNVSDADLHGYHLTNAGSVTADFMLIGTTAGDGFHVADTDVLITFARIGEQGVIGDDGIEIINIAGDHTADIIFNNVFGLGVPDPVNRGIFVNVLGGSVVADLVANFFATGNQTIQETDAGVSGSLRMTLDGNSTLTTNNADIPTMEILGRGLNSTIISQWDFPQSGDRGAVRRERHSV